MLSLLFFSMSAVFFGWGVYRLKGPVSVWFLATSPYGAGNAYAPIPFGLATLIWSLAFAPFIPGNWRFLLFLIGGLAAILGVFILPSFLKPSWLRWLEREHGKIIPLLCNEIQEMGYHNWDQRINTQQDLEQWVEEVQRKRGW
jgi:hypothetical protein